MMALNIANFSLVLSLCTNLLLIFLLIRQNAKTPAISIYAYLIFLLSVDILSVIYILNAASDQHFLFVGKLRFIIHALMLATFYFCARSFSFSRRFPRIGRADVVIAFVTALVASGAFFNFFTHYVPASPHIVLYGHSWFFWVWVVFFSTIIGLIVLTVRRRAKQLENDSARELVTEVQRYLLPLTFIALAMLFLAPYFAKIAVMGFLPYFFLSILSLYGAMRYHLLDLQGHNRYLLPQIGVSTFFILFYYLSLYDELSLQRVMLSIPIFLGSILVGYYILLYFTNTFRRVQIGYHELLDQKTEKFSAEVSRVMDINQLWELIDRFCSEILKLNRIAILTARHDITPYQIDHLNGFEKDMIQAFINRPNNVVLEKLEIEQEIINKLDYNGNSDLYRTMDQPELHIAIPLVRNHQLLGLIFLGGDRQHIFIQRRHIHILKVISAQIAISLENIYTIDRMVQNQKMAGLGMLASQIAHDFQSFITLSKMQNKDNERLIRHAGFVEKMVQDLLNYARPQELKLSKTRLNHLIDMTIDLIEIPENVTIERDYTENFPDIEVDTGQIRRVFNNLINNSIRACRLKEHARIKISTRILNPASKVQASPLAYIQLMDEGAGIPDEFQDRIFEPFFTTHKNDGGNGLGLAIVKQIIERHGGYIDVASKQGKGTVFNIRIPARSQQQHSR